MKLRNKARQEIARKFANVLDDPYHHLTLDRYMIHCLRRSTESEAPMQTIALNIPCTTCMEFGMEFVMYKLIKKIKTSWLEF